MHLMKSMAVNHESIHTVRHRIFLVHPAALDPTAWSGPACVTGQETRMTSHFPVEGTPDVVVGKKLL